MDNIRRRKDILHQLVKARNAVKRKYNLLKYGKENFEKTIRETFKPIVDPLQKLVETSEKQMNHHHEIKEEAADAMSVNNDSFEESFDESSSNETVRPHTDTEFESAYSDENHDEEGDYIPKLMQNKTKNLDKIYGVRKQNGKYLMGNLPIFFEDKFVKVKDVEYPRTDGLLELILAKQPDRKNVSSNDMQNYRKILEATNAHKRRYKSDEQIRAHNSKKFNNIIAPMFNNKSGGGLLPRYKIAKRDMLTDYIYWDNPNELVDRLRLLIAEREAGNPSHTNEIHSIIEELREAGYIY